jgi:hypothetical protein
MLINKQIPSDDQSGRNFGNALLYAVEVSAPLIRRYVLNEAIAQMFDLRSSVMSVFL